MQHAERNWRNQRPEWSNWKIFGHEFQMSTKINSSNFSRLLCYLCHSLCVSFFILTEMHGPFVTADVIYSATFCNRNKQTILPQWNVHYWMNRNDVCTKWKSRGSYHWSATTKPPHVLSYTCIMVHHVQTIRFGSASITFSKSNLLVSFHDLELSKRTRELLYVYLLSNSVGARKM